MAYEEPTRPQYVLLLYSLEANTISKMSYVEKPKFLVPYSLDVRI